MLEERYEKKSTKNDSVFTTCHRDHLSQLVSIGWCKLCRWLCGHIKTVRLSYIEGCGDKKPQEAKTTILTILERKREMLWKKKRLIVSFNPCYSLFVNNTGVIAQFSDGSTSVFAYCSNWVVLQNDMLFLCSHVHVTPNMAGRLSNMLGDGANGGLARLWEMILNRLIKQA